ncbi:hypothetical protein BIFPSEUDO_04072 [Bifidobacterium pseudocatenulatum DSM 20438 = JCM 1200 = LMG 10505]|uniref:Uncharacterized protein n=1 Tax=Bifidobacterium pseudocatenulatum DSM 20438 = JCM 1200 = LMG 10505 TaxID=547043 RepID=C0BUI5_BIFPS|nr:hypothetical protein BIFPSEUDO_04072 [Bifidobacterium pseudocatenulatum DSM 20438 = JCM 1200 = LMG 10505]
MHNILQNITITHNERDGTKLAIYTLTLRRLLVLMMTYIAISRSERHQTACGQRPACCLCRKCRRQYSQNSDHCSY